jgi:P27 family predicted phage terminase small subunit
MAKIATPKHLSSRSKRIFRTIATDFELDAEPHAIALLAMACEAVDRAEQARTVLSREGLTYMNARGEPRSRPEVAVERDSAMRSARLFRELSLDASDYVDNRPPRAGSGTLN